MFESWLYLIEEPEIISYHYSLVFPTKIHTHQQTHNMENPFRIIDQDSDWTNIFFGAFSNRVDIFPEIEIWNITTKRDPR